MPGSPPSISVGAVSNSQGSHPAGFLFTLWSAPGPSPDGGNYFMADGGTAFDGTLSQTISGLQVGSVYNLGFWEAAGQEDCFYDDGVNCDPSNGGGLTQDWKVTFGTSSQTGPTMSEAPHNSVAWNHVVLQFLATSATQTLTFLAQGTPDIGPPLLMLDGVTLVQAPEANTSELLLLGLAACLVARAVILKRRKPKTSGASPS